MTKRSPPTARRAGLCRGTALLLGWVLALSVASCGLFGGGTEPPVEAQAPAEAGTEGGTAAEGAQPLGLLGSIARSAPEDSIAQELAQLARQFGWEQEVANNTLLRLAVQDEEWEERVEPFLVALFFNNGFSVLPSVGEGHEFSRDSLVRGDVGYSRFKVTTRNPVRLIFLQQVENATIIYPQDGEQPQVFTRFPESVIAVRESRLEQYLR